MDSPSTINTSHSSLPLRSIYSENEEAIRQREDDDALNEIIMAVDVKNKGTVGCSYYVARQEKLYIMDDAELGGLEVVKTRGSSQQTQY